MVVFIIRCALKILILQNNVKDRFYVNFWDFFLIFDIELWEIFPKNNYSWYVKLIIIRVKYNNFLSFS